MAHADTQHEKRQRLIREDLTLVTRYLRRSAIGLLDLSEIFEQETDVRIAFDRIIMGAKRLGLEAEKRTNLHSSHGGAPEDFHKCLCNNLSDEEVNRLV